MIKTDELALKSILKLWINFSTALSRFESLKIQFFNQFKKFKDCETWIQSHLWKIGRKGRDLLQVTVLISWIFLLLISILFWLLPLLTTFCIAIKHVEFRIFQ